MEEKPGKSGRIREISPDKLAFDAADASSQFDFSADERRRFQRATLQVPIALQLLDGEGSVLCSGTALLRDLSLDGAFLTSIKIEETAEGVSTEKLGQFQRIKFVILDGPYKGVEAAATPIRSGLKAGGVGVKLEDGFSFEI